MRLATHTHPFLKVVLLGTFELGLLPLRLIARLTGGVMLAAAAIGIPVWLIQLAISLAGGGSGGGPLPVWAMPLALAALIPGGRFALRLAGLPGPLRRSRWSDSAAPHRDRADEWEGGYDWEAAEAAFRDHESDEPIEEVAPDPLAWAYHTLGLSPTAGAAEIKAAYRRLAHLHHPDHNPGSGRQAAERFAAIHQAYEAILATTVTPA